MRININFQRCKVMNYQLTKQSSSEEIKKYFNAVLRLAKASEEFPVNLDEVWPLVYERKEEAVRALTSSAQFIQDVDYQVLRKNAENPNGGRPTHEYSLSVSCMEFFIARKVRAVFEVYRQVFHHAVTRPRLVSSPVRDVKAKIAAADWLIKTLNLNKSSKLMLAKTIAEPLGLPTPDYTESKDQLLSASELLKRAGSSMSAQAFNAKMKAKGLLTDLERQSRKGIKKFKSLTKAGLEYGENQVTPNNPKETQPLYYVNRFDRLLCALE